ncbi:phosphoserine phosphatase SerB [Mycetocola reblochoni]|uniref:phosphoserine phosphatase n=2 Tax=Mycetocola reblochoni TaxID=331618 RepID=A0A1R4J5D3_9MICO|nr:phosphoserine phosphatase SerB [Mycetocola reblochoni]RLP69574.1 phosphoserine phosphatase SerB [Mycetocola reblochoni]SJN27300.1 Phosphoserine phosphatase [Mycetocola reblochoni REB411]
MTTPPSAPARFLVVLDADSTLLASEAIEELAEEAGTRDRVAEVTTRAMRGELDFAASLRERVATLAGLDEGVFARTIARVEPNPGAHELIAAVHDAGGRVGVVSGGFHEVLDPIADGLGVDVVRANRLEVEGGRLTGRVTGPVIDAAAKAETLIEWTARYGLPPVRAVAVGDGANDLEMMAVAGLSVAFNAKPAVRRRAGIVAGRVDLAQLISVLGI